MPEPDRRARPKRGRLPQSIAAVALIGCALDACLPNPEVTLKLVDVTENALGRYYQSGRLPIEDVGSGAAIGDLDGDGRLDLIFARAPDNPGGAPLLLLNDGKGMHFRRATEFETLGKGASLSSVAFGDYDRDGDLDVYLGAMGKDILLENDGHAGFTDVTARAGVAGPDDDITTGAVWVDLNDDGLPDLFVTNFVDIVTELATSGPLSNRSVNRIYLNDGDGTFTDVTDAAQISVPGASYTAAMADIDGDGKLEIYVANDHYDIGGSPAGDPRMTFDQLWILDDMQAGVPRYSDVAGAWGLSAYRSSMGIEFPDIDSDGQQEVYITDYGGNDLYFWNAVERRFTERAHQYGLDIPLNLNMLPTVSWGALALDLNRNGKPEMLVFNGQVAGSDVQTQSYLEQTGAEGYFQPALSDAGLNQVPNPNDIASARGAYKGDLDGDGDDDVVMSVNGGTFMIYQNGSVRKGDSVRLSLVGTVSAPNPIGTKVTLALSDGTAIVRQLTGGGTPFGQSDPTLDLVTVDRTATSLEIDWPSGFVERLPGDGLGPTNVIREPEWLTLSARRVAAGSSATLTYTAFDEHGVALGAQGAGRTLTVSRSDGVPVVVTDVGDGTYTAAIDHPGIAGAITLSIDRDGTTYRASPRILFD